MLQPWAATLSLLILFVSLLNSSAAVELMRTEQLRSARPHPQSTSEESSPTSQPHYRNHHHNHRRGGSREEDEDDDEDESTSSTSATPYSSTSSTTTTTTTDAWPSRRRRAYGFCEQGGEACWDDMGCLQSYGVGDDGHAGGEGGGGHRRNRSSAPDHGPPAPGAGRPSKNEEAEEEELLEVLHHHRLVTPHRYSSDNDGDQGETSASAAKAFGYSLIYLGDVNLEGEDNRAMEESTLGYIGRGRSGDSDGRPEDRGSDGTQKSGSGHDKGGGGMHSGSSLGSNQSQNQNQDQNQNQHDADHNDGNHTHGNNSRDFDHDHDHSNHSQGDGDEHHEGQSSHGELEDHGHSDGGGGGDAGSRAQGYKHGGHNASSGEHNHTGDEPNYCRQVYVEQLQGKLGKRRKMERGGRCYNDITRPCVSKYECDNGAHKCLWSDAELLGGHCALSKVNCTGRWDCPLAGVSTGDPSEEFDECEVPKLCEDDNTVICRHDSECSDGKRCISRCKVEMAQSGLNAQCEEDRPCFWNNYKTGEHYLFDYRWRHGPYNTTRQCLPACPETLDSATNHVNVTCLTRPFGACFSQRSNLRCEYGEFYNGVDPTPGEACRCRPHHLPRNYTEMEMERNTNTTTQ